MANDVKEANDRAREGLAEMEALLAQFNGKVSEALAAFLAVLAEEDATGARLPAAEGAYVGLHGALLQAAKAHQQLAFGMLRAALTAAKEEASVSLPPQTTVVPGPKGSN